MDKTNKINHKTLFLLDLTSDFTARSSGEEIEFDVFTKNRSAPVGITPLPPICKSLWTCTVESVMEYSRIVFDLFPEYDKLLSFIAFSETKCTKLLDWHEQTLGSLGNSLAQAAMSIKPSKQPQSAIKSEAILLNSIVDCLTQLAILTPLQWQSYKKKKEILNNQGRLIVITNFQNTNQANNFIKALNTMLIEFNKLIDLNEELNEFSKLPIHKLHLVLVNTFPVTQDNVKVIEHELHNVSPVLDCEILNTKSGTAIALKMITILLKHYNLASTTVTGIPMKEEQNSSSSANYDVEIVHSDQAHLEFYKHNTAEEQLNMKSSREEVTYDSVSLKWCTPKGSSIELHQCLRAHRITAVKINSRPSSCLINFLLSGRTVMLMLEIPRLKSKCMSHMLSSHCGELYIHTLCYNTKSIIDDPPSVSEGTGGRVTDYRINDFGDLMRANKLEKCTPSISGDLPIEKARLNLVRQTHYWPLTFGHSIIFNLANHIQPLLSLIPKDSLSADDVNECRNSLFQLVAMENKNANLPLPSALPKAKSMKKEELYKLMWKELEYFIKRHANTKEHNEVLSCLKELNSKVETIKENIANQNASSATKKFSIVDEGDLAWKEFDRYHSMTEREKDELNANDVPDVKRPKLQTNSIDNPMNRMLKKSIMSGSLTLASLAAKRTELDNGTLRLKEFKGRQNGSNICQLYTNLTELKPENPL